MGDRVYAVGENCARKCQSVKSFEEAGLFKPQLFGHLIGHFFKGKPCQEILQIALDRQRLTNAVFPVIAQLFDLVVVLVKKRMGVAVVDQTSDHA